jgi:hypothetical protein
LIYVKPVGHLPRNAHAKKKQGHTSLAFHADKPPAPAAVGG